MPRISEGGLKAASQYKYQSGAYTPLDMAYYKLVWNPVGAHLPPWLAANLITIIGCVAAILHPVILYCSAPNVEDDVPWWAEVLATFLIFVYQTADAVDGMQARKTDTCSPFGSLLDHGCDCFCCTAITLGMTMTFRLGLSTNTFVALILSWVPFWFTQWEAVHTGIFHASSFMMGVEEGMTAVMLAHLATAYAGSGLWLTKLMIPGIGYGATLKDIYLVLQAACCVYVFLSIMYRMCRDLETPKLVTAMWQVAPIATIMSITMLWPICLPSVHPFLCFVSVCSIFTRLAVELGVCSMTREDYPSKGLGLLKLVVLLLPVLFVAGLLGLLGSKAGAGAMTVFAVVCFVDMCWYIKDVVQELTEYLGVSLFFVTRRSD